MDSSRLDPAKTSTNPKKLTMLEKSNTHVYPENSNLPNMDVLEIDQCNSGRSNLSRGFGYSPYGERSGRMSPSSSNLDADGKS
jgi:hypothetical protein